MHVKTSNTSENKHKQILLLIILILLSKPKL